MAVQIVSNLPYIIKNFTGRIHSIFNTFVNNNSSEILKTILFMSELSTTESVNKMHLWKKRFSTNANLIKDLPALFWSRGILQDSDMQERGRRGAFMLDNTNLSVDPNKAKVLQVHKIKIPLNFLYVTNRMEQLEIFEIFYTAFLRPTIKLEVTFPLIPNEFFYSAFFEPLEEINLEESPTFVSTSFSAVIEGDVFILMGDYPYIKEYTYVFRDLFGDNLGSVEFSEVVT